MNPSPSKPLRILSLSTTVGALGTGLGGGVELTLHNISQALRQRGHAVTIVAPCGSHLGDLPIVQIPGQLQTLAQTQGRTAPVMLPPDAVLANMWAYARTVQDEYDLLLNYAYDWLPLYVTPFFRRPIAHLISMGSLSDAMDQIMQQVGTQFPGTLGVHSRAQAATFATADDYRVLGNGLDLALYEFCPEATEGLGWVGRLAPEKGLEDAIAAASHANLPLQIWGAMANPDYWQQIQRTYPDARVDYRGFLPTAQLQRELGHCKGLLMTPKWIEAFGNVAIEALACGVPVIAYRRGGPAEIVMDGKTGWLVQPDSVEGLVEAIARLDQIDRAACRQQVEADYSMAAMGDRVERWLMDILVNRYSG